MSHGDNVLSLPPGFSVVASTPAVAHAAMANPERKIYAVQFHPEVAHTDDGALMLHNFLFKVAGLTPNWTMASFVDAVVDGVRSRVGADEHVVCGLSAASTHGGGGALTRPWATACTAS
jgi:GMP synthase (glutamine-hydrolysing)